MQSNEKLYVNAVFFNPRQAKSRDKYAAEFIEYIKSCGAELFLTEIAFASRPFKFTSPDNPMHLQLRTFVEMWHKERGLNLGFQKLIQVVPDCKYIANIDMDVTFSNSNWVTDTVHALHHYCVVQPFSEAQNLSPDGERQWSCPSVMKQYDSIGYHQIPPVSLSDLDVSGHPGLAWAWRRETLELLGGLIDFCVAGSGDTHIANSLCEVPSFNYQAYMPAEFKKALMLWAERCALYVKGNVGYVNGICMHKWHGKPNKRGYNVRWDIVCFHQFNPYTDLVVELNGLYKFSHHKPKMAYDIRRSLINRKEDSIDE
jgi:hypothetical protein